MPRLSSGSRAGTSLLVEKRRRQLDVIGRRGGRAIDKRDCSEGDIDQIELLGQRLDHAPEPIIATSQECLAQVAASDLGATFPKIRDRRQPLDLELGPRRGLDVAKQAVLAWLDERDRHAVAARSAGPSDAVDILIGVRRDVVVDDVTHVIDVQATGGHIGCDKDIERPIPEPSHDSIARFLGQAPVESPGIVAATAQGLGEVIHFATRSSEDER